MSTAIRPKSLAGAAAAATLLAAAFAPDAAAQSTFTRGNFVVVQIGTPGGTMSLAAQSVNLIEYTNAAAQVGASHPLPDTGALALTLSGSGSHDGHLTVSDDLRYLYLGGYRTNAGAGAIDPVPASASVVPRVAGRIAADWSSNTTTALTDAYDKTEITAVVSDNGQRLWTIGSGSFDQGAVSVPTTTGGLRYVSALGNTTSVNVSRTQTTGGARSPDSMRSGRMIDGQIYIATASSEAFDGLRGAFKSSPAPPTSGNVGWTPLAVNADGDPNDSSGKFAAKSDAVFLDLNPNIPGFDTIYGTGGKAEYEKWTLGANGVWTRFTQRVLTGGESIVAMDASIVNGNVHLLATTPKGLYELTDTSGYGQNFSNDFTKILTAPAGTEFRGVAFLVPEPSSLVLLALAATTLFRRRRTV